MLESVNFIGQPISTVAQLITRPLDGEDGSSFAETVGRIGVIATSTIALIGVSSIIFLPIELGLSVLAIPVNIVLMGSFGLLWFVSNRLRDVKDFENLGEDAKLLNSDFNKVEKTTHQLQEGIKSDVAPLSNDNKERLSRNDEHLNRNDEHLNRSGEHLSRNDEHLNRNGEQLNRNDEQLNRLESIIPKFSAQINALLGQDVEQGTEYTEEKEEIFSILDQIV